MGDQLLSLHNQLNNDQSVIIITKQVVQNVQ